MEAKILNTCLKLTILEVYMHPFEKNCKTLIQTYYFLISLKCHAFVSHFSIESRFQSMTLSIVVQPTVLPFRPNLHYGKFIQSMQFQADMNNFYLISSTSLIILNLFEPCFTINIYEFNSMQTHRP